MRDTRKTGNEIITSIVGEDAIILFCHREEGTNSNNLSIGIKQYKK